MAEAVAGGFVRAEDAADTLAVQPTLAWAPTWTNLTKGTGATEEAVYVRVGRIILAQYTITIGTGGAWSATISFTLPVESFTPTVDASVGQWMYRDASTTDWYSGTISLLTSTSARCAGAWNGTLPVDMLGQSGTSPVALASGDKISLSLSYIAL